MDVLSHNPRLTRLSSYTQMHVPTPKHAGMTRSILIVCVCVCVMVRMDKGTGRGRRYNEGLKHTLCFPYVGVRTKSAEAIVDCGDSGVSDEGARLVAGILCSILFRTDRRDSSSSLRWGVPWPQACVMRCGWRAEAACQSSKPSRVA